MNKKITGVLGYISILGWLIAYLAGDKEGAKFHLNQSLVLNIASLVLSFLTGIEIIGLIASLASVVVFIFSIMGIVYCVKDQDKALPLIGGIQILK